MSQYQLIALDMDGTLLNGKKEITPGNRKALERAARAGKDIVLSTGRCRPELWEFTDQIPGLRYLNCTSGALVYDLQEKKEIYKQALAPELVKKILEFALLEGAMMHLLDRLSIVQTSQWTRMEDYGMGVYKPMYERVVTSREDLYGSFCSAPFPVEKVNLYHKSMESRERTIERVRNAGLPVTMAYAESSSLEFSAEGVDKGIGLTKLCEHLGLPLSRTIAVGDADNDLSVLKAAGLSVAMGNANEAVKAVSDVVVADCEHDGCAEAIERFLL